MNEIKEKNLEGAFIAPSLPSFRPIPETNKKNAAMGSGTTLTIVLNPVELAIGCIAQQQE
ncbi:MAG: hypothetical protein IKY72_03100 [Bacteroidaceae bacterium]|nr:hypothetical protein [Bacteroidaceae bacterium]